MYVDDVMITNTTPTLIISPTTGTDNQKLSIQGNGFGPGDSVTVKFDTPSYVLTTTTVSAAGTISTSGTVTYTASNGTHTITATTVHAGTTLTATASYTIPQPTLVINPASGSSGASVTFTCYYFNGGSIVASPQTVHSHNAHERLYVE